jgi:hypothetical protein
MGASYTYQKLRHPVITYTAKDTGNAIHFIGEQIEEERVSGMSKNIIDGLRYAYEAYCRGDIEGAVDAIDLDPNILWIEPNEFYAGGTYRGREAVIDYLTLAYAATEQVQNVPEEILVVGDKIAVFLHFQAWPKAVVSRERATLPMSIPFMKGRSCRCRPTLILPRLAKPSDLLTNNVR